MGKVILIQFMGYSMGRGGGVWEKAGDSPWGFDGPAGMGVVCSHNGDPSIGDFFNRSPLQV